MLDGQVDRWALRIAFWDKTQISGRFQIGKSKIFFYFFWKISSEKVFYVFFVAQNGICTHHAHGKYFQRIFNAWFCTKLSFFSVPIQFSNKTILCLNSFSNFPRNDKWSKMSIMDFFGMSKNSSDENLNRILLFKITSFARNICFQTKNWEKIKNLRLYSKN